MVAILTMSAKLATVGLLKIKVFRDRGYDVIIFMTSLTKFYRVTQFGNSSISMRESYHNLNFIRICPDFFYYFFGKGSRGWEKGCCWFKSNNL